MKQNTLLMRTVLVAALLGAAVSLLAEGDRPAAAPKAAAGSDDASQVEEPKIPGLTIPRAKGGFLGLEITQNSNFKLSFYDENKKPVPADVSRANLRWPVQYSKFDERTVLTPTDDGLALTSNKFVRPPYTFRLFITLVVDGSDQPPEICPPIDFHQ
jgi:hypothetical protein